jgi:hypothetical protein
MTLMEITKNLVNSIEQSAYIGRTLATIRIERKVGIEELQKRIEKNYTKYSY